MSKLSDADYNSAMVIAGHIYKWLNTPAGDLTRQTIEMNDFDHVIQSDVMPNIIDGIPWRFVPPDDILMEAVEAVWVMYHQL